MAQIRSEGALIQSIDLPLLISYTVGSGEDRMEHEIELTDPVPQTPHDSPLLGVEIVITARPDISAARPEVSTAESKTPPTTTLKDM
nr:hypothetical protein [Tanacetum cinerariifolium]